MNKKLSRAVLYSFVAVFISDLLDFAGSSEALTINLVFLTAVFKVLSLYCLIFYVRKSGWETQMPVKGRRIFRIFMIWNIITIIRGAWNAGDYWDWRFLGLFSFFSFLVPNAIAIGVLILSNAKLFRVIIKKVFIYSLAFVPLSAINFYLYSRAVIGIWLFVLLNIYIKNRARLLIWVTALLAIITSYEIRANALRVIIAICLFLAYYFRRFIRITYLKIICFLLFITPFIFIYLGTTGIFNVFSPFGNEENITISSGGKESSNLVQDTRTGLYIEVFNSILETNTLIFGGGATAKYKSEMFFILDEGRGRYGAEVGFLNMLLYAGTVGVLFYFLILIAA